MRSLKKDLPIFAASVQEGRRIVGEKARLMFLCAVCVQAKTQV